MSKKIENLRKIVDGGIVVIIRSDNAEEAQKIAEASIAGGVGAVEVTMSVPGALKIIESLARTYKNGEIVIGAGTVLDAETARAAILAGAELLVSPHLNVDMVKMSNRYQAVSIVGAMTPKEIMETLEAGADMVKLFPAELLGPQYVKTVKAPIPQASIVPTGGATPQNVHEWIQAGCDAVGVGSYITKAHKKDGDYNKVTLAAREFVEAVAKARRQGK
ncbi:bifunctional 2-keto-4-hydroxyglutarate aldolase/2-keto-3-deoxy-6-phosphogluconate aldolase [Acetonema longum]|uniref:2-dehydro-3-deoxyphosphogluconate aldolase/4-hydroxy-2-oxoglutarate aldolase n=1 Tax=Acetonema longum DSM 6540 TaxID=1009370 RepID=F7NLJ8_9FIRM|nr:bifunctional 2-keto-4-hydroxyglutarate aldolase/2-keto-3-deoxy-6-phosphogluconate aldolase [Acetonema longum]EGO63093.1 2-dehydro-3-deoxyphosphogluconate aldolase/4-hydroxy-2-oxoglutarate aldolase [Acetonema longum DSM 6540]